MNNYNFELDLYTDNANADIIRRIKPGSDVLEIGPAFGRMTKHLSQNMNCTVDIIEIDADSGAVASKYARNSCVGPEKGNIEGNLWKTILASKQYDAIVFTDVLEHLHSPERILKDCHLFLKDNGVILCSIPNIAHSSVILGLIQGEFTYSDTGLLDRTHIHFFTESSFRELAGKCNYCISYEHAIIMPPGTIELPYSYDHVGKDVENILRNRSNNEAYQYIFELKKIQKGRTPSSIISTEPPRSRLCCCYIKEENEASFSEQKKISSPVIPGKSEIIFSLSEFPHVRGIRLELLDCNALIRIDSIAAISKEKTYIIEAFDTTGLRITDKLLCFFNESPNIYFWMPAHEKYVSIKVEYEVLVYHSDVLSILGKEFHSFFEYHDEKLNQQIYLLKDQKQQSQQLSDSLENLRQELLNHTHTNETISEENRILNEKNTAMISQLSRLQQELLESYNENNSLKVENRTIKEQLQSSNYEKALFNHEKQQLGQSNIDLEQQLQIISEENRQLSQELSSVNANAALVYSELNKMENSLSWKLSAPLRYIHLGARKTLGMFASVKTLYHNTLFFYKHYGLKASLHRARHYKKIKEQEAQQQQEITLQAQKSEIWETLSRWIDTTPHDFIDIFPVPMGWNTPLFQRFQHLSLQAGNAGGISFYGAHPSVDTDVETYKFVTPTLCIVNLENEEVTNKLWEVLDRKAGLKFLRLQSIDLATSIEKVEDYLHRGYQIAYEYIDELTPQITGSIPDFVFKRHEYLLRNEEITVVATSDKLFHQVKPYRDHNMVMLNNGVDYNHWNLDRENTSCPNDIKEIVAQEKIIIGYHGALAQWIDYDLLNRIADDKRFILLLIGYEHDGNLKKSKLLEKKNVYYIGSRNYQQLSQYAAFYDIAILPFLINDITLSVSPVKIFEYMAAGKPVVTYALPECKKYQSCLCAETQDEFIELLDNAIILKDSPDYLELLKTDALANTWTAITKKMVSCVKQGYAKALERRTALNLINPQLDISSKERSLEEILRSPRYQANEYREITKTPYIRQSTDCKVIAYYLTQFHPDSHNEIWWGKGVTEWNNVSRAVPQYPGHYQPRLPGELGFYDLRIIDNMRRQIELAQMYGVYGFSFYYYWFNGERLLEKPLEMFLEHPELDFPFSLCWANENWTKRFDGTNLDILMEQPKSVESYKNVIHDIARFLQDSRYITINGQKMLTVYRPSLMPEVQTVLKYWREYCREQKIGELHIIAVKENMIDIDWLKEGYDAISEFHPGTLYTNCLKINTEITPLRKDFCGEVFSYPDIVHKQKYFRYDLPKLYRAVMPMWDNTARRDNKGMIFQGSTPSLYKRWLKDVIQAGQARQDLEENIIFINAWNEWGEGAYLEPDKRYGYAYLEATKEAVEECRRSDK